MLTIEGLTRNFAGQRVLNAVSMQVPQGQVACIVGPSGCGKSTLLRLVAGLDVPDAGRIALDETELSGPGWALEARKRRLNMVFQDYALWPHMRVAQIVGYGLRHLNRHDRDRRVAALLDQMQIARLADRLPSQISGGQQQRVAIARALATDPDLLLLDEPLSNLDVQLRLDMRMEFAELFARVGKTVLYVTHDPLEACSFADTLVVMRAGGIEESGTPEALFARPRSEWIATLAGFDTRMPAEVLPGAPEGELALGVAGQVLHLPETALTGGRGAPGQGVTLMLHPGAVALGPPRLPGQARLSGRVRRCLFEGRHWRVTLSLGATELALIAPERLAEGSAAEIHFDGSAAVAFPQNA
ncbi:ABC transporter ATP-binding protein [Halodurantibacterium flavum]|uniref:ABC transporter ATP-binding protein n=1 Tax=Halodurantibacterium flavum TaxID=1382802 RepID=A0ABW4S0H2_9RHOB